MKKLNIKLKMVWTSHTAASLLLLLLLILLLSGEILANNDEDPPATIDVSEGQDATLECRFYAKYLERDALLYWIRTNRHGHDNVAIGKTPYENHYRVELSNDGRYDLKIINATYDRDNGKFECRMKEGGSGKTLHSKSVELTVLLKPSPPKITPSSPLATEGRVLNLTCSSVGGSPPPEINWYRQGGESLGHEAHLINGKNKDEPTRSILSVLPTKQEDGSSYRCTVWNRALDPRQKLETSTKIHVNYFPRVTVGPENPLRVEKDETAQLECHVDAKPNVSTVKWTRNGRFIETHFKHTIPRVTLQDSGSYVCSADNGLGQVGKAELKLDVLYGPVIELPLRREINENEDITVDCNVAANPRPSIIQWYKEGDEKFRQNGPTLRLNTVSAIHNGRYVCSATNHIQLTSQGKMTRTGNASMDINVRHRPGQAEISPVKPIAVEGKSITLKCGASPPGYPTPQYRWWKEGSNTTLGIGSEFTIDKTRLSNAGRYYCQPTNELGRGIVSSVNLHVYQAPKVITQLQPTIMKRAGDTGFHITCSAVGKPKPKVHWFKDGQEIKDSESNMYQINTSEQETIPNMAYNVLSTLKYVGPERISSNQLMPTDRGHYTCQFDNDVARTETTMLLRIEHSPVVVHQHNKVAYDIGETAIISCKMQAFPIPRFDWSFGNSILQSEYYDTNVTSYSDDIYEAILRIYRVTENSYGEYNCKGINTMGAKKTIIKLQPKGKPERPSNVRAVDTGYNYITLGWDEGFNGGYNNTFFTVQYRKQDESSPRYEDCRHYNPCNITGLEQHAKYYVKVKASNIRGESKFSHETLIVTKIDVSRIPKPTSVHFEKSTSVAYFNVNNANMPLIAKIELENKDGTWNHYDEISLKESSSTGEIVVRGEIVNNLRVRYCLEINKLLCGPYAQAKLVDVRPSTHSAAGEPWIIAVIIFIIVVAIIALILIIKCCCSWSNSAAKKAAAKKDKARPNIVHSTQQQQQQPPPYSFGIENKGVDTLKDADEVAMKNNMVYNPHQNGYEQESNSNSNSANGGSVNSQDSLWNVKNNGGGGVPGVTSVVAADQFIPQQQQSGYIPPPQHVYGYDQQYMPQQPQQQQQQHQQQATDYTHYPYPDEYLNERNRQYLAPNGGDPYNKQQQQRQRMDSDYSPYGDVSGLPDPYMGHLEGEDEQQPRATPFEDSLQQSGDSGDFVSPNGGQRGGGGRRIIREIIV